MLKLALLIGAGASYGAGDIAPETPPLGGALFDRLTAEFPATWRRMLNEEERLAFGGDPPFEHGMARLRDVNDARLQPLLIDMGLFFARFRPAGQANRYRALLEILIGPGRVCQACSLNYECVFEQVAESMGIEVVGLTPRRGALPRILRLYKPHGSCNYLMAATRCSLDVRLDGNEGGMATGPLEVVPIEEVGEIYEKVGQSFPPAMSLYEPTKSNPVSAETVEAIRAAWASAAETSDIVLAIGARPILDDTHIWTPVIEGSAEIWFVGGEESAYEALDRKVPGRLVHVADTFEDALAPIRKLLDGRKHIVYVWPQAHRLRG